MGSKKKVKLEISRGKYVESQQLKKLSFKRVLRSFKFSFDGLKYAYLHEQSLAVHVIVMSIVIICGFKFNITFIRNYLIIKNKFMMKNKQFSPVDKKNI